MTCTFRTAIETVQKARRVESNCNGIAFYNTGSDNALINGFLLQTGAALIINGHQGETDCTQYDIVFQSSTSPRIDIVRKIYQK